jgi:Rrf2 family protein
MISARVHYASLALIELTNRRQSDAPVTVREITKQYGIPGPFLVQILRTLRSAGLVESIRGSQGGYRLSIDPDQLTLLDIADAFGGQDAGCKTETTDNEADRLLHQSWNDATEASRKVLATITLQQIARQAAKHGEPMFYI